MSSEHWDYVHAKKFACKGHIIYHFWSVLQIQRMKYISSIINQIILRWSLWTIVANDVVKALDSTNRTFCKWPEIKFIQMSSLSSFYEKPSKFFVKSIHQWASRCGKTEKERQMQSNTSDKNITKQILNSYSGNIPNLWIAIWDTNQHVQEEVYDWCGFTFHTPPPCSRSWCPCWNNKITPH